ncbi:hypothetical protein cypCar_00044335 [Cyprinus carpio]|nr:hypothetical protein cypCar_00044335 [Cyprinus carpio]
MTKLINALQETLNPHERRGFVDSFLIQKQKDEKSSKKDSYFHEENLMMSVTNLFVAGTDTTGTTLRWGLMLMAKYLHIQDRVQEEIDRVIGGRQPVVEDRKKLPYTDAVIHETQRLANIVPLSLPHVTSCDVTFNGYFIKKGTTVVPLLTSVLKDPSEWEKPNSFYPEHFLDEKGQFVKRDAFIPFSAGRRVCLGESLARMELFLFFTSLLQSYRFSTPPGVSGDDLDLKGVVGITLNPSPHKLCAIRYEQSLKDRVQEETDQVIGGRQPVTEDRKNLPYTDAVIHKTQRFANIAPMSIPHMTSCDVTFNGYFIKKGTFVFPLLMSVLWDEDEWETPHTFNPKYFLDELDQFVKRDAFLLFSAGTSVADDRLTVVLESSLTMALVETLLMHMFTTEVLLAAVLLFLVVYLFSNSSNSPEDPPGPKPLPLLGNLHLLDLRQLHMSLLELSKKYGSVFTVHFGPKKFVVLAGYKTVKQALVNQAEEFGERDITPIFQDFNQGHGIVFANGDSWKAMRRFALSALRDFGMGKKMSEEKIVDETCYLREVFDKFQGNPFDTTQPVNYAVSNIISAIVYGKRFDYEDPKFQDMVDKANKNVQMLGSVVIQIYNMCPALGPWMKTWRLLMKNVESLRREIKELVNVLQETLNPLESRGFIDSFLIYKQSTQESGERESHFHEQNLLITVSNLFTAGTDTTGSTLRWGLMLMAKYPHIQDRVQEEIDQILAGREPASEDRKNVPYTDAVIHEIQRLANIVPMNLPHMTSCDVSFNGYFIKKAGPAYGTCVLPLLTSVLRDENEWETPDTFNPEHFLDEKGQLRKRDAFMPFSAGRRVCPGESLARMELFLFFTSLLQCFRFTPPPGVSEDDLDLTPVVGLTLNPSPHKLCAISRTESQPN